MALQGANRPMMLVCVAHDRDAADRRRRQIPEKRIRVLNRREFLEIGSVAALSLTAAGATNDRVRLAGRFDRKFAAPLGLFCRHAGSDPLDQIRFLADEGGYRESLRVPPHDRNRGNASCDAAETR